MTKQHRLKKFSQSSNKKEEKSFVDISRLNSPSTSLFPKVKRKGSIGSNHLF